MISSLSFLGMVTRTTNNGSNFEEWSQWTPCFNVSGDGIRKRFRVCLEGFQCPKQLEDVEKCTSAEEIIFRSSMILFFESFSIKFRSLHFEITDKIYSGDGSN